MSILCSLIIFGLWLSTLVLLFHPAVVIPVVWLPVIILVRTFIHTGLFIVAHDAAHGVICPQSRTLNHGIGTVAIIIYALLPYNKFVRNHFKHHCHPASEHDPDYFVGEQPNFFTWYLKFMLTYLNRDQCLILLIGMTLLFHSLRLVLGISAMSLVLFWLVPSLLSSLQLFYFGTYLPHQPPSNGHTNRHRASSSALPRLWSFLSCYYFGYHWEHHEYPHLPWFRLPTARSSNLATVTSSSSV